MQTRLRNLALPKLLIIINDDYRNNSDHPLKNSAKTKLAKSIFQMETKQKPCDFCLFKVTYTIGSFFVKEIEMTSKSFCGLISTFWSNIL
jgi:hypothetical protein